METTSRRNKQPAESPSPGLMLMFSVVLWRGTNAKENWTSLFTTQFTNAQQYFHPMKHFPCGISFACKNHTFRRRKTQWERRIFTMTVFLEGQNLCLAQDVLSEGTKQTWNKEKICRSRALLSWSTANEEQIPVDTTFGVNQRLQWMIMLQKELEALVDMYSDLYGLNHFFLNMLHRRGRSLFGQTSHLDGPELISTAEPIDCWWPTNTVSRKTRQCPTLDEASGQQGCLHILNSHSTTSVFSTSVNS